jgi:hypothetical protein
MRFSFAAVLSVLLAVASARAQDAGAAQPHHTDHSAADSLFRPREASGTAWVPDDTAMSGWHGHAAGWQLMAHGSVFAQLLYESGGRHRTGGFQAAQISSVNWGMLMARRRAGAAIVGVRAAFTADPWTVSNCGFINLLANGEMCEGDTFHDRQHPHDAFMELAVEYDRPLRRDLRWQLYAGLAGEPALGPPGFPHRPSAALNPIAPITHHWLDSTHTSFGVVTGGVYGARWKIEGSVFNGREPDDRRADLDLAALDSVAGRISFMPTPGLALQVSAGRLREAEAEFPPQPRSDVNRATASVIYHRPLGEGVAMTATAAYGVTGGDEVAPEAVVFLVTHALLLETSVSLGDRHTWFGRLEVAGKPGHDLHVHEAPLAIFPVGKIEGGYVRHFATRGGVAPGIGGAVTANLVGPGLAPRYSGRVAWGLAGFVTLRLGTRQP